MSSDVESWLTRTGRADPAVSTAAWADDGAGDYKAWGQGHPDSKLFDVRLRPESGLDSEGELLPFHYLLRVTYSTGSHGDAVTLSFADCIITARGRNLKELRRELVAGKVSFIEQFDARRWPEPALTAPKIDQIDVVAPGRARPS